MVCSGAGVPSWKVSEWPRQCFSTCLRVDKRVSDGWRWVASNGQREVGLGLAMEIEDAACLCCDVEREL